jgi:hypothetical protein
MGFILKSCHYSGECGSLHGCTSVSLLLHVYPTLVLLCSIEYFDKFRSER